MVMRVRRMRMRRWLMSELSELSGVGVFLGFEDESQRDSARRS